MAHSIQDLCGRSVTLNDFDVIALVALAHEIAIDPNDRKRFDEVVKVWDQELVACGPGSIDLRLNSLFNEVNGRSFLLRIMDSIKVKLDTFKEKIPAEVIQKYAPRGVVFKDYCVLKLVDVTKEIESLLRD